jgi:glucuronate isomerase
MRYLSEDFLLHSKAARTLYHDYAALMPILDYHCHLSPRQIAEDAMFSTMTEVWLKGDHYKWRIMRNDGVDENSITGNASDEDKFSRWAKTLSGALRNPLYDWTHLELQRYFGIDRILSPKSAATIYAVCNEKLKDRAFSARNLLKRMNVATVCTTDDPIDDLSCHARLKREKFGITVLPTFRPDKAGKVEDPVAYNRYIDELARASDTDIASFAALLEAIDKRHAYFHDHGCRSSDHGFETLAEECATRAECEALFSAVRAGKQVDSAPADAFRAALLRELCRMNQARGWVQQLHFGVIRNVRTRLFKILGPDTGIDCIGDFPIGRPLCSFLDALDATDQLTKTILFNIHPGDNEMFVSIMSAFQDGSAPGKLQLGPSWWFLDNKDGIRRHFEAISGLGLLGRFIGMTTDSRSFLSFPRHEYFRRILCDLFGEEMEKGDIPDDPETIGAIVRDICYNNAKKYFSY